MNKLLLLTVMLVLSTGCASLPGVGNAPTPTIQPAPTARTLASGSFSSEGRVVPLRSAALALPNGGVIAELPVTEGEQVHAGQLLLRLDQSRADALVAQAEAELASAQATFEQRRTGASPEEIAAAEAQLRAAQAQLRQTSGGVTPADRAAAQAQLEQAKAHLSDLQSGPKPADLYAAEAQLAEAQASLTTQRDQLSAAKTDAQLQISQRVDELTRAQAAYGTAKRNWEYAQQTGNDPNAVLDSNGKKAHLKLDGRQLQAYNDALVQAEAAMHQAETAVQQAQVAADAARQAEVSGIATAEQQVAGAQAALDKLKTSVSAADLAAARSAVASSEAAVDKLTGDQRGGALDVAQAAVDQAQANLDRLRSGTAKSDLAVAAAEVQRAEATLKLAQVSKAETELHAPFDGTIGALMAQPGEYVAPNAQVVQLADISDLEVETTDLTERNIARVREGMPATVTFDALPDLEIPGTVSAIRPLGENKQGDITYTVRVRLDQQDPRLRWNMTALVALAPQE